jgi:iron only hydrogenase large subunit-like protein
MRSSIKIKINGKTVEVEKGTLLLQAILNQGIFIPTLCFVKESNPYFSCRICLVYEENSQKYIPSCSTRIHNEMSVITHNVNIIKHRQLLIELILANHPDDCLYCVKNETCNLRKITEYFHIQNRGFYKKDIAQSIDKSSQAILLDYSKCILCGNCVYACNEVQGCKVFQINYKGINLKVEPEYGKMLNQSSCVFCGECLKYCPTAAIYEKENINNFIKDFSEKGNIILSPLLELDNKFNIKNQRSKQNRLIGLFKNLGIDKVFSLNAGVDIFLYELYQEFKFFLNRKQSLVSSFCPSINMYFERYKPKNVELSKVEIPSIQINKILKNFFVSNNYTLHEFSGCIALKQILQNKVIDEKHFAYTSREISKIKRYFSVTEKYDKTGNFNEPCNLYSALSFLPFLPGGTAESIARMYVAEIKQEELENDTLEMFRQNKDFFDVTINVLDNKIAFGIINGMGNIKKAFDAWKNNVPDFIDVLACLGGCSVSGGMSFDNNLKEIRKQLYEISEKCTIRLPQNNKYLINLYEMQRKMND